MADIFREIEEEVRRDQALDFWKKYQNPIIGIALAVVAATAGYSGYRYFQERAAQEAGAKFQAAVEAARENNNEEANKLLDEVMNHGTAGYKKLARFRDAAAVGATDPEQGVKAYEAMQADKSLGPLLQDLARLRAAVLVADTASREDLTARLQPLVQPGNPWAANAREILGLAALKAGDTETAGKIFDEIVTDRAAPAPLKQRAEVYLALVRGGPVKPAS
jgi:hypothetical protein